MKNLDIYLKTKKGKLIRLQKNWIFTGRIKYEKINTEDETRVLFEVEWFQSKFGKFLDMLDGKKTETIVWCNSTAFTIIELKK